ncbi:MAG TPA: ABC transporter permease [Ktedonobacterales bacterium]
MDIVRTEPLMSPPEPTTEITPELARKRKSQGRLILERFLRNRTAVAGFIFLALLTIVAFLTPFITHQTASYDPSSAQDLNAILQGPSAAHPLGTDALGRDELARVLFGARVSLEVGIVSMFVSLVIGVVVGSLAGYYGGWIDALMMRVTDAFLATPLYLVLFVLSIAFSRGTVTTVVILIGALSWASAARIVRSEFISIKQREFLLAARTLGADDFRLMFMHILPNAAGPILVTVTLLIGNNIITESVLSFFGFGLQAPQASWGTLLNDSQSYIVSDPLLLYVPLLAIILTVLSFNLMGDGLRDALDPYMTQR